MLIFVIAELNKALLKNEEHESNASFQSAKTIVNELIKLKGDQAKETCKTSLELKSENDNLNKKLDQVKLMLESYNEIKADFNNFLINHVETYEKIKEIKKKFENL